MTPATPAPPRVHVIPGRAGAWTVRTDGSGRVESVHPSTTQAERAAQRLARARGAREVIVHDRYCRVHRVPLEN